MPEWLSPEDTRWREILGRTPHDFYHLPCYALLESLAVPGRALAYHDPEGGLLVPLIRRPVSGGGADAVSPYGYAGPLSSAAPGAADLTDVWARFVAAGREAGLVTSFLRLHPLLGAADPPGVTDAAVEAVATGRTVSIDLTLDEESLRRTLRENHRRDVRKLLQRGFSVRHERRASLDDFGRLYRAAMRRHGAEERYLFGDDYLQRLAGCLGSALHYCSVLGPDGDTACAGLFTRVGDIVQYHLGATAEKWLQDSPSKLMFVAMRDRARAQGARVLHLGGGVGGREDSLLRFKRGFGTDEHVYATVRVTHDAAAYRALNAGWLRANEHVEFPDPGFFPLYRSRPDAGATAAQDAPPARGASRS